MAPDVVRPVDTGALFNTSRHALGICRRVCNTCRYSVPNGISNMDAVEAAIENAVATVIMKHGVLRVGIADEDKKQPCFSFVASMDLRKMISWRKLSEAPDQYDEELLRSLQRTHDSLWDDLANKPGWEVIVHHSAGADAAQIGSLDITFAFHHAHADGVASHLFHRDLLKALNAASGPPEALQEHVLCFDAPPELLPGMNAMVPLKISWGYLLRTVWNEIVWRNIIPSWLKSKPSADSIPWTGGSISFEPHQVNLRLLEVPQQALRAVLLGCREHKTTLTPLLHVLIAASLAKRMPRDAARAFATTTPIDLRRYARSEYDVQDNITGMVTAHEDVLDSKILSQLRESSNGESNNDAFIWQTASQLCSRLRQKVSTLPNDDIVGMLSWVSDWQQFWTDKIGANRSSTWEVSNVGSLKAADLVASGEGGWSIVRSLMTQGALPAGCAFTVSVAGVEGNGLCLSFSWQETIVDAELMDAVVEDVRDALLAFRSDGSFRK